MVQRIVIKTILMCVGVFLMLSAAGIFIAVNSGAFEFKEPEIPVITAKCDIASGMKISADMLETAYVKQSDASAYMVSSPSEAIGKLALADVKKGDYIRNYTLSAGEYPDDWRATVVETEFTDRLANLVGKGSYIDIRLVCSNAVYTVLSKARVDDVIDETGASAQPDPSKTGAGKKLYLKFVLPQSDIEKICYAKALGKIAFELYLDEAQPKAPEISKEELLGLIDMKEAKPAATGAAGTTGNKNADMKETG